MADRDDTPTRPGVAPAPADPGALVIHRRRRSDVTWTRVIIVLGLATLGIVALALHSEMVAGMLIGGAIGSNVPLGGKGGPNDRSR